MHAWLVVLSRASDIATQVAKRYGAVLGTPSAEHSLPFLYVADFSDGQRVRLCAGGVEILDGDDEGSGEIRNRIAVDRDAVTITTDVTGLFPAYFTEAHGAIVASSHLHLLASAVGAPVDGIGEFQFFVWGYSVGERTLYSGVQRARPASTYVLRFGQPASVAHHPELYVDTTPEVAREVAPAAVWAALRSSCAAIGEKTQGPLGVFLSGGLDSRLVLAAAVAENVPCVAATHGHEHLQEVKVARRIARLAGAQFGFVDVDECGLIGRESEIEDLFWQADHLLFPWWRCSAKWLTNSGVTSAATGYLLDASLGGHFHDPRQHRARLKRRLQHAARRPGARSATALAESGDAGGLVESMAYAANGSLAYRPDHLAETALEERLEEALSDVRAELAHYQETGTSHGSKLTERFKVENHARKFSFSQELIARRWLKVAAPTASHEFLRLLSSFPSHWLLDHHLYFKMMRRHTPRFALVPGSNGPVPPFAPTVLLELSRAARNRYDRKVRQIAMRSAGERQLARFGSINYESATRRPGALDGIRSVVASRSSSRVNTAAAKQWFDEIQAFKRSALNMVPMTTLATIRLAEQAATTT